MSTIEKDVLHRFLFEDCGVRGELVRLDATWQAVRDSRDYPAAVQRHLGEALAGVLLLAGTIKLHGALILQAQGKGPLRTLVAQATGERTVRGLARWDGEVPGEGLETAMGGGRLVMTIQPEHAEGYQGVVPLEGETLAEVLGFYFRQSEQLPTGLWLASSGSAVAGLLLQQLPSQAPTREDWERLCTLAETLTEPELLELPATALLRRLFHEEDLRLFEAEPVAFRCRCSRSRIEQTLVALGPQQLGEYADADGSIEVTCEFCNRSYSFDIVDIEALFTRTGSTVPAPPTRQ